MEAAVDTAHKYVFVTQLLDVRRELRSRRQRRLQRTGRPRARATCTGSTLRRSQSTASPGRHGAEVRRGDAGRPVRARDELVQLRHERGRPRRRCRRCKRIPIGSTRGASRSIRRRDRVRRGHGFARHRARSISQSFEVSWYPGVGQRAPPPRAVARRVAALRDAQRRRRGRRRSTPRTERSSAGRRPAASRGAWRSRPTDGRCTS